MAKGYESNKARKAALSALGRALARRAGSHCELCDAAGVSLHPWEVPPAPADDPDLDRTLMLCQRCGDGASGGRLGDNGDWHFLEGQAWNTLPPVQVTAVRLLRRLASEDVGWAQDTLDGLFLDDEITAWIDAAPTIASKSR